MTPSPFLKDITFTKHDMCTVERLLEGLTSSILPRLVDPQGKGIARIIISTPLPESAVAEYLTELAARVEPKGVKVGSYPRWGKKRNTVTLVGRYIYESQLFFFLFFLFFFFSFFGFWLAD